MSVLKEVVLRNALLILFVLIACTPAAEPPPAAETAPAVDPTPLATVGEGAGSTGATPDAGMRNIRIESVEIANPVVVSGEARTFENHVALRARDANGDLIVEGFTTATGEMGTHSPYRGTLWLTRHPGDQIRIEALEYSAKDGSEQSLVVVERPFGIAAVDARLWFPDPDCTRVNPHVRRIPNSISMARLLVEALIAGPTAEERRAGAVDMFPKGSAVRSVNLRDGVLTVDFNERLQNVGGSCRAQMIRAAVTETLRSLPSVSRVVVTADGSEPLALQP